MEAESRLAVEVTEQKSISTIHFSGTYGPLSVTLMKEIVHALIRNRRYKLILAFDRLEGLNQEAYDFFEWAHDEVSKFDGAIVLLCPTGEPQEICSELEKRYHFLIFLSFEQARNYFIEREF